MPTEGGVKMVEIERIVAGRAQPRRQFNDAQLEELAASIRAQGVIQPLVVVPAPGGYELIAGERRLRAAARAGLEKVPVVVRERGDDGELLELALVENLQREDLQPLERARAYQRLATSHGYTQEQIAERVGKSRASIANTVRLLALPDPVLEAIEQCLITEGHARAILQLPTAGAQILAMRKVVQNRLSVRDTEELVKAPGSTPSPGKSRSMRKPPTADETALGRSLGTRVRMRGTPTKGRIEIEYFSAEELIRLMERLLGPSRA